MSRVRSASLFVALAVLWGTAFVAIKAGLDALPPVLFAALRYDVAAVLVVAYAARSGATWRPASRADWLAIAAGATLVIAGYNAFLFLGEQGVTSGVAAILVAANPILAATFAGLVLPSERVGPVGVVGLVVGFAGVVLVSWPDRGGPTVVDLVAPALVVLAAVSVALGSVLVQYLDADLDAEGLVAWSCVGGALLLHAASLALPGESLAAAEWSATAVLAIAYLAVVASAVGYVVYFRLLERVGAVEINLISYATAPVAALAGWLVLGEVLDALTLAGFALVFVGFATLKRRALADATDRWRATTE